MVSGTSNIKAKNKIFPLNQNLTYANYGVYVATGVTCSQQYVGQTVNKFYTRWTAHRGSWNKPAIGGDRSPTALLRTIQRCHRRRKDFGQAVANRGFFQVVVKSISPGVANSGEIAFYQPETRRKQFFY